MFRKAIPILWTARKRLRRAWALVQDSRVPLWQKAIPFLPLIYILSPLNFLGFAIPVLGQVDDVMLVFLAMDLFERVVDKKILADYQETSD